MLKRVVGRCIVVLEEGGGEGDGIGRDAKREARRERGKMREGDGLLIAQETNGTAAS